MRNPLSVLGYTAAICASAAMLASPAAAQMTTGYKFLEAVRKQDGTKVEEMLSSIGSKGTPGSVIINSRDISSGDTALHIVIAKRELKWLTYFIAKGADVNLRNFKGTTPLWLAVSSAFTDGAQLLIAKGARINDPGPSGETPLIAAVHQKNLELVKSLIAAGADLNRADSSGRTPLDYAQLNSKGGMIVTELENGAKAAKVRKAKTYGP